MKETLATVGGKQISAAIGVFTGDKQITFSGKFAVKPSKAVFDPVEETINGRFVGFDDEKKELLIQTESKQIRVNYSPVQICIVEVAKAVKKARQYTIRTHRTTSRCGIDVFSYVPDAANKLNNEGRSY